MTQDYLNSFQKWFTTNRQLLADWNATVELSTPPLPSDKRSRYADVDFDDCELIGRIVIRESLR